MKKKVSVSIDATIEKAAKDRGINISKVTENTLISLINAIDAANGKMLSLPGVSFTKENPKVRLPGFEPGSSTWQIDWITFKEYVEKDHNKRSSQQICSNAEKYVDCLIKRDLTVIRDLNVTVRANAMKALSALSKFLGCYDDYRKLIKAFGLKWGGTSPDDLFIERMSKIEDPEEIWEWIRNVKTEREDLADFMDLMALSGLRLGEAVNSFNLIIKLSSEGKLSKYFVADKSTLEHFKYKDLFIRRSKKAFISFVPIELVEKIKELTPILNANSVMTKVKKRGLPQRFSDVREAHGTFLIKFLKDKEIDFLHGRVTSGVFMQHYFNPALISDLRERTFKGIAEIQEKIKT